MKAISVGQVERRCRAEGGGQGDRGHGGRRRGQEPILDPMGRAAWV